MNLIGPYRLTIGSIDDLVKPEYTGNYILGEMDHNKEFIAKYVGRSDNNLNQRLKNWIGKYNYYYFCLANSVESAFKQDCRDFHSCKNNFKLDNEIHPQRPEGKNWDCPMCSVFDKL